MIDIIIHTGVTRDAVLGRIQGFISALSPDKAWHVCVKEWKGTRSQNQNRALWSVAYGTILRDGGEALAGYEKEDLHEFFLGSWGGWEVVEIFGQKRQRPIRRSSKLTKAEFADFFSFIQRKAAEFGIYIEDPDPMYKFRDDHHGGFKKVC